MSTVDARIVKHLPGIKESPAFDLDVYLQTEGGITVVVGSSGAGKTLILDCLGGFIRPDEGRILVRNDLYFDSAANVHLPPERRRCGYIFQDHALFSHMTVRQNLRFAAELGAFRSGRLNVHRRINELLETFDLSELGDRKPAQLSGGQQQRAALARILVSEPNLLLLDEPSRGLDAHLRQVFYELLRSVQQRLNVPVILVSHDIEECFALADSVAVVQGGRLLQQGPRDALFTRPASVDIARLLGIYNIAPAEILALDPSANSSRLRLLGQQIEGPYFPGHLIGDTGFLCMRRSELKLTSCPDPSSSTQLTLSVYAQHLSSQGVRLELAPDFSLVIPDAEYRSLLNTNRVTFDVPPSALAFTAK